MQCVLVIWLGFLVRQRINEDDFITTLKENLWDYQHLFWYVVRKNNYEPQ